MQRAGNSFILAWLAAYSGLTWASSTFAQDVVAYDWVSLMFALAAGLLGGAARTILTLVSDKQLVGSIRMVLFKDLVVALFGGGAAYLFIQGYNSWVGSMSSFELPTITRDFRVLIIVAAGFSRGRWLGVIDRFTMDAIANASHRIRGAAPPDPAPSIAAPLGEK